MTQDALTALVGLGIVQCLAVLSPGPAFLIISRMALRSGRAAGTWGAVAIGLGSILWAALALSVVGSMAALFPTAFLALRLLGIAYFVFLGIQLWRKASSPLGQVDSARALGSSRAAFLIALGIQLTNPKAALFFTSVFATFAPATFGVWFAVAVGLIVFLSEFLWFAAVSWIFSRPRNREIYLNARWIVDRCLGCLLITIALHIALRMLSA